MATKHATSKLRSFGDLYGDVIDENSEANELEIAAAVSTLGFRGEALFSLANISKSLVVSTRTKDETIGEELSFDSQGTISEETRRVVARSVGTTVSVNGLFERLPVRRVDLCKRIKSQRMKMIKVLQGCEFMVIMLICSNFKIILTYLSFTISCLQIYSDAIMCLGTQFQLIDVNSSKSKLKSETVKLATSDSSRAPTLKTRASSILGTKFIDGVSNIDIDLGSAVNGSTSNSKVQGLISCSPASPNPHTAREIHLFSINGRPVDLPNISRLITDVWKVYDSTTGGRRPACVLAFTLPNNAFDVNLSPDKREVMFTEEAAITGLIKEKLTSHWAEQSEGKFEANEIETRSNITNDSAKSKQESLNKITPKSSRKQKGENSDESLVADQLQDRTVITPTVTQTQSYGSAANDSTIQAVAEQNSEDTVDDKIFSKKPKKASHGELIAWEQTKLGFNRIGKSQQQEQVEQLLTVADLSEPTTVQAKETAKNTGPTTDTRREKRQRNSFLDQFAFKPSTEGRAESGEVVHTFNHDESSLVETNNSDYSEAMTIANCNGKAVNRLKRKVQDREAGDVRNSHSDKEEVNEETPKEQEVESFTRRKVRADKITNKSGKLIAGERILMSDRGQSMQGRARSKEPSIPSSSPACSSRSERFTKRDVHNDIRNNDPNENKTTWKSFSGTQSIIAQSRQSQKIIRKRQKVLRESLQTDSEAGNAEANEEVESVVNLSKEEILHMDIIGQFNLGFILARCRNHNLWMLDQHACDEKYNFEKLCKETVILSQKLLTPLQLELSPSEEHCILEHKELFERNGFTFEYSPEKEPRQRLALTSLPHSGSGGDGTKAVQFGKEGKIGKSM